MTVSIEPGYLKGLVVPPSSKSMTQRAYAAALLHKGRTVIHHAGASDDELAALRVIQQLGARVISQEGSVTVIESDGVQPVTDEIDCGESGLAARLFTPIAAIAGSRIKVTGSGTLLNRPMPELDVLRQMGVLTEDFNGHIPLTIGGALPARSMQIDASGGSQLLSGLLFALSAIAREPITIDVKQLKSKPYTDLTLATLAACGKHISHDNYRRFHIDPSAFEVLEVQELHIAADWSSAAVMLVAGATGGEITVSNLVFGSGQADEAIMEVLQMAGADMTVDGNSVTVRKSRLKGFEFDATHCPDLFPILAILAACGRGDSYIEGVHRLFDKESNRVESVTEMLHDFGLQWSVENDTLSVNGMPRLGGTIVDSYKDHRIVMAAAIGALRAKSRVDISYAEAVNKSYPAFFRDLELCGGRCTFT